MRQEYGPQGVGILAVSLSSNLGEVPSYARRHGFHGMVAYFDSDDGLFELGMGSVPTTYVVNAEGRVIGVARGGRSRRFFAKQAEALLQGEPRESKSREFESPGSGAPESESEESRSQESEPLESESEESESR